MQSTPAQTGDAADARSAEDTSMTNRMTVRRALLSVSDKTDLVAFARALAEFGIEIISTGGTASALTEAGIAVIPIESVTGVPEMLDGRVKTLHPAIHGGLLGRRDDEKHLQAMAEHGIEAIDLICVNLYPFERTILKPGVSREQAIEQIDIGGPAMIRSAAKNHESVAVVTAADQYDRVISELRNSGGTTSLELRRDLAAAAFSRTAEYDATISAWMCSRRDEAFPDMLRLSYTKHGDLRYGENPHQAAALYANPASHGPNVVSAELLAGKPLSYNNIHDGAAALEFALELHELVPERSAAVIVKHANPCGAAVAASPAEAFSNAYEGDPLAAFGGILAVSTPVDSGAAKAITAGEKFLEVIIAPSFDDDAVDLLSNRWKNVRLLATGSMSSTNKRKVNYKSVPGGMLVQERDVKLAAPHTWQHAAGPEPTEAMLDDGRFVWTAAKHLKSNAVAIGANGRMLGGGCGQVDRVSACRLAIEKAGNRIGGDLPAVAASDGFFPFPDGPELLVDAGIQCIVQPGGSRRDEETIDLCNQRGICLLITGVRHFRH